MREWDQSDTCTECGGSVEGIAFACPWCMEPMCHKCWSERDAGQCSKCEAAHPPIRTKGFSCR